MNELKRLKSSRVAVSTIYFCAGIIFASWASRIPDIQRTLGMSDGDLGKVLFAIPAGQLSMMFFSGYLVNRYGSRVTVILSAVIYSLILIAIPFAHDFKSLFLVLFLFGVAANMLNIAENTQACVVEHLYGRNIMSSFHGLWSLGGLSGGIVGTLFVSTGLPIAVHYGVIMAMTILAIGIAAKHLASNDRISQNGREDTKLSLSSLDKTIIIIGFTAFGGMFCEGIVFDWSSVYFANVIKPEEQFIRLGYIAGMGMMTIGRFCADRFVTRYKAAAVLRFCGICITTGVLTAVLFPNLVAATFGFALVGLGISSTIPICYSIAGRHRTLPASIAITVVSSISFLGFMIGPPIIGLISEATNLRFALGAVSVFGLLIVTLAKRATRENQAG